VVFGSLTTCDPGNIHTTIDALERDRFDSILNGSPTHF
jgi:hypothetical protein